MQGVRGRRLLQTIVDEPPHRDTDSRIVTRLSWRTEQRAALSTAMAKVDSPVDCHIVVLWVDANSLGGHILCVEEAKRFRCPVEFDAR